MTELCLLRGFSFSKVFPAQRDKIAFDLSIMGFPPTAGLIAFDLQRSQSDFLSSVRSQPSCRRISACDGGGRFASTSFFNHSRTCSFVGFDFFSMNDPRFIKTPTWRAVATDDKAASWAAFDQ